MSQPKAPENFFVNRAGNAAILVWDKTIKDIEQNYTTILGYNVYVTSNPNGVDWGSPVYFVDTSDGYTDADVFHIYYTEANLLYRVCAWDGVEEGECATSIGIISEGEVTVPAAAGWDLSKWDEGLFG